MNKYDKQINHFIEAQPIEKTLPSSDFVSRLKQIPFDYHRIPTKQVNWFGFVAVASFIGFMLINLLHVNQSGTESNILETYISDYSYFGK